jgi:hypothetical protein
MADTANAERAGMDAKFLPPPVERKRRSRMFKPILGYLAFLFGWMAAEFVFLQSHMGDRISKWCAEHITLNMVAAGCGVLAVMFLIAWLIVAIREIEKERDQDVE